MTAVKSEIRGNALAWLALVALTVASFAASDSLGRAAALPVLVVAATKSSLVGFRFMGLGEAHGAVRAGFAALVGVLVMALWFAQRIG